MHIKNSKINFNISATIKSIAILRHAAQSLFHFPYNEAYFIILYFSAQIIFMLS
jgi:hypothetical protein